MPYTMKVQGIDEISNMLSQLEQSAPAVAAQAVYEGAGTLADELSRKAKAIRTEPFKWAGKGETRLPSPEEKEVITQAGVGIAKFDKSGTEVQTSVGYGNSGYAMLAGKYKRPIPLIVNAINSGTSFMQKQPFVRRAANTGGKKASAKMMKTVETAWSKIYHEVMDKYGGR